MTAGPYVFVIQAHYRLFRVFRARGSVGVCVRARVCASGDAELGLGVNIEPSYKHLEC